MARRILTADDSASIRAMVRHLPILILTTESNDDFKARAKAAGATGWITKPFRPDQLSKMVELLLASLRGF